MFLYETKETNTYTKKSKFGKLSNYQRTKTITHWECDECGEHFTKIRNGKYNKESKSYCKNCIETHGINKLAGKAGYESKIKNKFEPRVGNIIKDKQGYKEIYIGKNYPYRQGGYRTIREHVYVMECFLNRALTENEIVHHIDGDKQNNNIDNLFLTSVQTHNELHAKSEHIIFELYKKGIVKFDRTIARYYIDEEE
jgi:hypothetical protein